MPIFLAVPRSDMAIPWNCRRHTPVIAGNHVFTYAAHPVYASRIEKYKRIKGLISTCTPTFEF